MRSRANINFHAMYSEIESLKHKYKEPRDPSRWWHFIKDINFWISVAKIIFKYFFK